MSSDNYSPQVYEALATLGIDLFQPSLSDKISFLIINDLYLNKPIDDSNTKIFLDNHYVKIETICYLIFLSKIYFLIHKPSENQFDVFYINLIKKIIGLINFFDLCPYKSIDFLKIIANRMDLYEESFSNSGGIDVVDDLNDVFACLINFSIKNDNIKLFYLSELFKYNFDPIDSWSVADNVFSHFSKEINDILDLINSNSDYLNDKKYGHILTVGTHTMPGLRKIVSLSQDESYFIIYSKNQESHNIKKVSTSKHYYLRKNQKIRLINCKIESSIDSSSLFSDISDLFRNSKALPVLSAIALIIGAVIVAIILLNVIFPDNNENTSITTTSTTMKQTTRTATKSYYYPEPESGYILQGRERYGESEITVTASSSESCVVKLKNRAGNTVLSFFVRAGETVTVGVPSQYLYVYFASGKTWYGENDLFGEFTSYSKDSTICNFEDYTMTYTLYPVTNGNFSETPIDEEEFK